MAAAKEKTTYTAAEVAALEATIQQQQEQHRHRQDAEQGADGIRHEDERQIQRHEQKTAHAADQPLGMAEVSVEPGENQHEVQLGMLQPETRQLLDAILHPRDNGVARAGALQPAQIVHGDDAQVGQHRDHHHRNAHAQQAPSDVIAGGHEVDDEEVVREADEQQDPRQNSLGRQNDPRKAR